MGVGPVKTVGTGLFTRDRCLLLVPALKVAHIIRVFLHVLVHLLHRGPSHRHGAAVRARWDAMRASSLKKKEKKERPERPASHRLKETRRLKKNGDHPEPQLNKIAPFFTTASKNKLGKMFESTCEGTG